MLVAVLNGTNQATLRSLYNFNDLIERQSVTQFVTGWKSAVAGRKWNLLTELDDLDVHDLTLLINHSQLIFVNFENQTGILVAIVKDKVACFVAMSCASSTHLILASKLICV